MLVWQPQTHFSSEISCISFLFFLSLLKIPPQSINCLQSDCISNQSIRSIFQLGYYYSLTSFKRKTRRGEWFWVCALHTQKKNSIKNTTNVILLFIFHLECLVLLLCCCCFAFIIIYWIIIERFGLKLIGSSATIRVFTKLQPTGAQISNKKEAKKKIVRNKRRKKR